MSKKTMVCLFLFLCLLSGVCFADNANTNGNAKKFIWPVSGPITSPFGYRIHPVFGTRSFHTGIDIGVDYNTPVHAAADGVVISAGWLGGYGNAVIIDHGNGLQTLYAHNTKCGVRVGQHVGQGSVISLSGSTGYSTGPHVHFEVRLGGQPVDPMGYLDGSVPVPDQAATNGSTFSQSDFNEQDIDFNSSFDFAAPLRNAINAVAKTCTNGLVLLQTDIKWLFFALVAIDLALSAMFNLFSDDWEPINWLLKRFLKYGFVLFLITHWGTWISNVMRDYFATMGAAAAGTNYKEASDLISNPTFIVQKGAHIISPVFSYIKEFSGMDIVFGANVGMVVVALVLAVAIMFCFFIIGFQIMLAYVEFYIVATMSVVTLGFGGLKQTKFIAEKGLGAVFTAALKLMIFIFLATFLTQIIKDYSELPYDFFNYLHIFLVALLFVFLGGRISGTAMRLLCGGKPTL